MEIHSLKFPRLWNYHFVVRSKARTRPFRALSRELAARLLVSSSLRSSKYLSTRNRFILNKVQFAPLPFIHSFICTPSFDTGQLPSDQQMEKFANFAFDEERDSPNSLSRLVSRLKRKFFARMRYPLREKSLVI